MGAKWSHKRGAMLLLTLAPSLALSVPAHAGGGKSRHADNRHQAASLHRSAINKKTSGQEGKPGLSPSPTPGSTGRPTSSGTLAPQQPVVKLARKFKKASFSHSFVHKKKGNERRAETGSPTPPDRVSPLFTDSQSGESDMEQDDSLIGLPGSAGEEQITSQPDENATPSVTTEVFERRLVEAVHARANGQNWACSPLSVAISLAISHLGATGATERQYQQVFSGNNVDDHTSRLMKLQAALADSRLFSLLNAVYYRHDMDVLPSFRRAVRALTGKDNESTTTAISAVDTTDSKQVRSLINEMLRACTYNLISEPLTSDSVTEPMSLLLVSAFCCKGRWQTMFERAHTFGYSPFGGVNGDGRVQMMRQVVQCYHITHFNEGRLRLTAVELPLSGPFSMVLVKTEAAEGFADTTELTETGTNRNRTEQFDELVHLLVTCKAMSNVRRAMIKDNIHLFVPHFSVEWETPLQDILVQDLDLSLAFDERRAEFGRTCFNSPVRLSGAIHKAVVTVNEEGSEVPAVQCAEDPGCVADVAFDSSFFGSIIYTPPSTAAERQQAAGDEVALFCFAVQSVPGRLSEDSAGGDQKHRSKTSGVST